LFRADYAPADFRYDSGSFLADDNTIVGVGLHNSPADGGTVLYSNASLLPGGQMILSAQTRQPDGEERGVLLARLGDGSTRLIIGEGDDVPGGSVSYIGLPYASRGLAAPGGQTFALNIAARRPDRSSFNTALLSGPNGVTFPAPYGAAAPNGLSFGSSLVRHTPGGLVVTAELLDATGQRQETAFYREGVAASNRITPPSNLDGAAISSYGLATLDADSRAFGFATLQGDGGFPYRPDAITVGQGDAAEVLLRQGQLSPEGDGPIEWSSFGTTFNASGQFVFQGDVDDGGDGFYRKRIYFWDDAIGLLAVAKPGDVIGGREVVRVDLDEGWEPQGDEFNDAGQVAFYYQTGTGFDAPGGIAVWTPPDWEDLLPGDANLDGVVNLADFGILRQFFGEAGEAMTLQTGDFNDDDVVNLADFGLLRANFGNDTGGVATIDAWRVTVPEPGAIGGLLAGGLLLGRRRMRRS
jgi:hypothetical protein